MLAAALAAFASGSPGYLALVGPAPLRFQAPPSSRASPFPIVVPVDVPPAITAAPVTATVPEDHLATNFVATGPAPEDSLEPVLPIANPGNPLEVLMMGNLWDPVIPPRAPLPVPITPAMIIPLLQPTATNSMVLPGFRPVFIPPTAQLPPSRATYRTP